jgi:hypothetical protein
VNRARLLPVLVVLGVMPACGSRDALDQIVAVPTASRFANWRAQVASDAGPDTRRRVEEALQEIRLSVSGERELKRSMGENVPAMGRESIDEAVRLRVDGRRLGEVLQLGYELRVRRLKEELAGLEDAMNKNAQLVTKPGDLESKHHLEGLQGRQQLRVEKYRADIAAAEQELAPLLARSGRRLIEAPTDKPDEMPVPIKPTDKRKV